MRRGFTNRRCPKCNGNIFVDQVSQIASGEGYQGWYEWCLQCGYMSYLESTTTLTGEFEDIPVAKELARV